MTTKRIVTIAVGIVSALLLAAAPGAQTPPARAPRFDELVRADFFAGFAGNAERLARGMKMCEEALAADPDHADALVWHGSGLMFPAGEAARQGDRETAAARARRGRAEIDRADQVAPDSLSVMLVRAVALNTSAPNRGRARSR